MSLIYELHLTILSNLFALHKQLLKNNSFIVLFISGSIEQRYCTLGCFLLQTSKLFSVISEFGKVPFLELRPLIWFVPEPLSQLRARGNLLQPEVYMRSLFRQASRPEPVNKNACSVLLISLQISSFDLDVHHCEPNP